MLKPAQATPAMISKAWACLRTSIFFRQSDAMTNVRADLMASRHWFLACAVGIPIDKSVAMQTAKPINEVCYSYPVPHAVKLHARSNQKRGYPDLASPSNLVTELTEKS